METGGAGQTFKLKWIGDMRCIYMGATENGGIVP